MNHIYRTVFNRALGVWQVVAEIASAQGKGRSSGHGGKRTLHLLALLPLSVWASLAVAAPPPVTAAIAAGLHGSTTPQASRVPATTLPSGGTISAGTGSITQGGAAMTIAQQSQNLAINWQSFDIGRDASVTFLQPNSSAIAMNRVLGTEGSQILGQLKGNGQVWVINPNGVLFGSSAQVSVGGLVASTLGLSDADFLAGKRSFSGNGGSVVNQGNLNGGYVALLGESVRNEGVIAVRLGTAALAAGNTVTLDFNGDALLNVQVDEGALRALADNRGLIQADGGSVLMTTRAKDALLDTAVNNSGVIRARTVENRNGRILLIGDMHSGTANIAGTLDASAPDDDGMGGNGGFIETSAARVKVADSAVITTRATSGGNGRWLIDPVDFTVAASGGDMTGAVLTNALANGDVEIQSTAGSSGVNGDVNIKDTVSWSQNTLTLNAQRDINVFDTLNASGTAGLFLRYGQADAGGAYNIYAPVNLSSTGSFRTQSGSAGAVTNWTIITSLGAEGSTTGTDLQGMNGNWSGNYVQGADIDASATASWNGGAGFDPIAQNETKIAGFTGRFDGLGHVISNLAINRPTQSKVGLFGNASGYLGNIGLVNASIIGNTSVGTLLGHGQGNIDIRNVWASGTATGTNAVGGIAGDIDNGIASHVHASVDVTATQSGTGTGAIQGVAGGLVGAMQASSTLEYGYASGDVRGGNHVGGLVGYSNGASTNITVRNGYFAGTVGGNSTTPTPWGLGALIGSTSRAIYENLVWNTDTVGASVAGIGPALIAPTITNVYGLATAQMRNAGNWTGFTFVTTPSQNGWVLLDGVLPMLASEWSPVIHTAHQLQLMALDLSARYTLAGDIDASATNGKDVWLGSSFASVGNIATSFTGQLDGQGHTIDGLHLLRGGQNHIGLFGVASNSRISNLSLAQVTIQGWDYVGGLVGWDTNSILSQVSVSGSVAGNATVGGLVGYAVKTQIDQGSGAGSVSGDTVVGGLLGESAGSATVRNSQSSATVSGTDAFVGGLAGVIGLAGSVDQSQASGTVSVDDENIHSVGGLVGENNGSITASSASGAVQGGRVMGGLVGANRGSIAGSHATGNVTGLGALGGLAGENHGSIDDSHAEGAVSGQGGVGGLAGETYGAISNSHATGNVTATVDYAGGLVGYSGSTAGTITNSHATGEVKGQNRVGGLVGEAQATISHSYAQGTVNASGATGYVGGLVGLTSSLISGSHATGNVTGNGDFVGGLAGRTQAAITNSYASGDVSGASVVGGLAGFVVGGNVSHGHASGNVTGSGEHVGGLLGRAANGSAIGNSYATGNASGDRYVGGLVGQTIESSISNSYATGNATSTGDDAGGLVGENGSTGISNSYASGDVSGVSRVGGLVGNNTKSTVSFSSDITNSYASGRVTGSGSDIGGLVGKNYQYHPHYQVWYDAGTITGSFWNINTSGQTDSAGGTGITTAQMQQLSTFVDAGWDISDQGGDGKVWRIYEGSTAPLLRSFMQQLTVTAPAGGTDKTYDGHIASGTLAGYTTSIPADASQLLGTLGYATTAANAGTYSTANGTLQLSGLHSTQQGYDISYAGASSLTINKAELTVTANNAGKTYDATAWSGGNGVSYSGFVNGENDAVLGGTLAYGGNSQGAVNAGNYLISASGLSSGNYAISYVNGTLTIDPRTLGIVVNLTGTVRKTYDGTAAAVLDASNFLVTGWVDGDGATITATRGRYEDANAGTGKRVTVDLTLADYLADAGTNLANYVLPMQVNGNVGVIDKAAATVTAHSATVIYNGQTQGVNGYTITGLVNGEDESVLDNLVETGGNGRNTGTYAHGVSGSDNNYALTFIDGTLTIDKAKLTVGSSDVTRTYDGTTSAAGTAIVLGGRLFGADAISGGSFVFTDKNAGTGKTVTVGGVTVDDGNGGDNYDVTYSSNTNSTILQKTVTIGGGFNAQDKLHDGSDRATIGRNALALQGAVAGDALTVDWQAAFADAAKGVNKTVTLRGTALAGGDSGNYQLDLTGAPTAVASILGMPFGAEGGRYAGATRSAQADGTWGSSHTATVPVISIQHCGQNLPAPLVRDCRL